MKESLKTPVFIRSRSSIKRQCMSAELKTANPTEKGQVPHKIKELRKVMHRRKSRENQESEEKGKTSLLMQAQQLAY